MAFDPRRNRSSDLDRRPTGPIGLGNSGEVSLTQAIKGFGRSVEGIGQDILNEEKQVRDQDFAFNRTLSDQQELDDYIRRDQVENGFDGHAERVQEEALRIAARGEFDAPSKQAKQLYASQNQQNIFSKIKASSIYERKTRIANFKRNALEQVDMLAEKTLSAPDDFTTMKDIADARRMTDAYVGTLFTKEEGAVFKEQVSNRLALSLAKGMTRTDPKQLYGLLVGPDLNLKGKAKIEEGQEELELSPGEALRLTAMTQDEANQLRESGQTAKVKIADLKRDVSELDYSKRGEVFKHLTPSQKASFLNAAFNGMKSDARQGLEELRARMRDASVNPEEKSIQAINQTILSNPVLREKPDQQARLLGETATYRAVGEYEETLNATPYDQLGDLVNSEAGRSQEVVSQIKQRREFQKNSFDPAWGSELAGKYTKEIQSRTTARIRQLRDDPLSAIMQDESFAQEAANAGEEGYEGVLEKALLKQSAMRVPNPRVTTSSDAKKFGNLITENIGNPDIAAEVVGQLESRFGKYSAKAFREIGNQKGVPKDLALLSWARTPESKKFVLDNMVGGKEALKNAQDAGVSKNDLRERVVDDLSGFVRAIRTADPTTSNEGTIKALTDQVMVGAAKLINRGMSEGDAVETARARIIDENFHVTEISPFGYGSGRDINVLIPRVSESGRPTNPDTIEAFMRGHSTPEALRQMGVDLPNLERLSREGFWMNNADMTGVVFAIPGDALGVSGAVPLPETETSFEDATENLDRATIIQLRFPGMRNTIPRRR